MTGPTHAPGGTLDLLITDVPDLVWVAIVAPLGSSDNSSHSVAISIAQAIPNRCFSRRMLLKHRVNWTAVYDAIGELPWRSIWNADNPVERLNVHFSLLVERFVLMKVICVRNKDKHWFNVDCSVRSTSSRRLIFGGLVIALELTRMSLSISRIWLMKFMPRQGVSLVSEAGMF